MAGVSSSCFNRNSKVSITLCNAHSQIPNETPTSAVLAVTTDFPVTNFNGASAR